MVSIAVNHQLQIKFYCLLCDMNLLLYCQVCRRSNNNNNSPKSNMTGLFEVWLLQNSVFSLITRRGENAELTLAKDLVLTSWLR